MSRPVVQIVGLQRSGTRWLSLLVANNYAVDVIKTGKHHMPGEYQHSETDATLVIWKRFDHWLCSALRTPVNLPDQRREMYDGGRLVTTRAAELYSDFYSSWVKAGNVLMVSYSNLLADPQGVLGKIAKELGWRRQSPQGIWRPDGPDQLKDWRRDMYLEGVE